MRRSSKKVTLVGRTNTIWQELDEYHRKNRRRMLCRTEDIDECLERQSQIEKEVGKLIDTDLDITWHRINTFEIEHAQELSALLDEAYEFTMEYESESYIDVVKGKGTEIRYNRSDVELLVRPKEIRDILPNHNMYYIKGIPYVIQDLNGKYRMSQRDRNGRLRPIVTNWTELKKRAIKFISDVKFRTVQSPVQSPV